MAVVDADYKFIAIDVGDYGSNSDCGYLEDRDWDKGCKRMTFIYLKTDRYQMIKTGRLCLTYLWVMQPFHCSVICCVLIPVAVLT